MCAWSSNEHAHINKVSYSYFYNYKFLTIAALQLITVPSSQTASPSNELLARLVRRREVKHSWLPWPELGGTEIRCWICCREEGGEEEKEGEGEGEEPDFGHPRVPGAERGRELVAP